MKIPFNVALPWVFHTRHQFFKKGISILGIRFAHARSVKGVGYIKTEVIDIKTSSTTTLKDGATIPGTLSCSERGEAHLSPKELLYSSLSSCTIATIRTFYSNSKQMSSAWKQTSLEEITVQVQEIMSTEDEHIPTSLRMTINLKGSNLSDAMRDRLVQSSSFCPVKRMLSKDLPIEVILQ